MQFFIWAVNDPSKSQRPTNKIPNTRHEKYFSELFVRDVLEMFKTLQAIVIAVDTNKKWKVSSHCWRHQALQTKCPKVTELELTLMPPSWGQVFMVLEGTMQTSIGEKQTIFLAKCDACESRQPPIWHNMALVTGNSGTRTVSVTKSSLIELKAHSIRGKSSWYWKPSQQSKNSEVMDIGGEHITLPS